MEWAHITPAVVVAVIGFGGAWVTSKIQNKGRPENALIDQMQQELATLRKRMNGFEARDRVYIPHIIRLNLHIEQGLGPPAPKIPRVILDFLEQQEEENQ